MTEPLDRNALLVHFRQMRQDMLAALDGISDDALTETSLDGWSVKDHLAHLSLWDDIRASEVERLSAGHASAWKLSGDQDDAFNQMSYQARAGLSLDQIRWEFDHSHARLLEAISHANPRALDPSAYGEAGLDSTHESQHATWIRTWRTRQGR
ncbi:MAG: hypothetical protein NVSMB2_13630 [Chloroflexota bacterium]